MNLVPMCDVGIVLLNAFSPGLIKAAVTSVYDPLWVFKNFNTRSFWSIIDDYGRAAFGLNGGANMIANFLDSYLTNEAQSCGN